MVLFTVDMYVLEITLYPVDKFEKLYRVKDGVYQKSDACLLGPLAEAKIKEWEDQVNIPVLNNSHCKSFSILNKTAKKFKISILYDKWKFTCAWLFIINVQPY